MKRPGEIRIRIRTDSQPLQDAFDEVLELLAKLRDELFRIKLGRKTLPW